MRLIICFLLCVLMVKAQEQVSEFSLEKRENLEWEFSSQYSFSKKNKHYILGASRYYQFQNAQRFDYNDGLHILSFDENFKFEERFKITFSEAFLNVFKVQIINLDADSDEVKLLLHKDNIFYVYTGTLNFESNTLENMQEVYKIELAVDYREDYIKIIQNQEKYCILQFDKKAEKLHVYELLATTVEKMEFALEKEIFKRLRRNFGLLQQIPEKSIAELDLTPGFQIHFNNNFIYLLTGDCVSEGPSLNAIGTVGNCSSDYYFTDLHLLKIDLNKNSLKTKIIGESLKRETMTYTILENNLFYSFFKSSLLSVNCINLESFEKKSFIISKEIFERKEFKAFYTNYSKKAKNIKRKEVDFGNFTFKYNRVPSIAIKKTDTLYDITLGKVKYKAYNSFGDWLGAFALGSFTSLASGNLTGGESMFTLYYFNNEIPKIHETRFKTDFNGYLEAFPEHTVSNSKKLILSNLDYFLGKRMVTSIGNQENTKAFHVLYRDKKNWKNFYVVKFLTTE